MIMTYIIQHYAIYYTINTIYLQKNQVKGNTHFHGCLLGKYY